MYGLKRHQDKLSESGDKVNGPVEGEEVDPLKPKSFRRFLVFGKLALDQRAVCASLKFKTSSLIIASLTIQNGS